MTDKYVLTMSRTREYDHPQEAANAWVEALAMGFEAYINTLGSARNYPQGLAIGGMDPTVPEVAAQSEVATQPEVATSTAAGPSLEDVQKRVTAYLDANPDKRDWVKALVTNGGGKSLSTLPADSRAAFLLALES
jgi:hypothetical protein